MKTLLVTTTVTLSLVFMCTASFAAGPVVNFKDGVIRDGSSVGGGKVLGNIKAGAIYEGSSTPGFGKVLGNIRDGAIREGSSTPGFGKVLGNVKDGVVRGGSSTPGFGKVLGNVKDAVLRNGSSRGSGSVLGSIKGMEREHDAAIVGAYHFLVKRIF